MTTASFLSALKDVATSAYALAGYVVVVIGWVVRGWLVRRPQTKAIAILEQYRDDAERTTALKELMHSAPPAGIRQSEIISWVQLKAKEQTKLLLFLAYIATLATATTIVTVSLKLAQTRASVRENTRGSAASEQHSNRDAGTAEQRIEASDTSNTKATQTSPAPSGGGTHQDIRLQNVHDMQVIQGIK
jgi:hypothetical protein